MINNRGTIYKLVIVLILLLIGRSGDPQFSWAFFQDVSPGVRPAGMGSGFVALADDGNAPFYNPAGLARLDDITLNAMYADLFSQLNAKVYNGQFDRLGYNSLSLVYPYAPATGSFSFSWINLSTLFYQEHVWLMSYGRSLWSEIALEGGASIKLLQWGLSSNDFTELNNYYPYAELGKTSWSADIGLLATPVDNLNLGVAINNIIPADIGLGQPEFVPLTIRLGLAYILPFKAPGLDSIQFTLEETIDHQLINTKFGAEAWFIDKTLAFRLGVNNLQFSSGASYFLQPRNRPLGIQMDYAFTYPFHVQHTLGSHRFGLSLHWSSDKKSNVISPEEQMIDYYKQAIKAALFQDLEQAKLWWQKIIEQEPDNHVAREQLENQRDKKRNLSQVQLALKQPEHKGQRKSRYRKIPGLDPKKENLAAKISQFQVQLDADPSATMEHYWKERLAIAEQYYQQKEVALALSEFENLQAMNPNLDQLTTKIDQLKTEVRNEIGSWYAVGIDFLRQKDYLAAMRQFEMILKVDSNYQPASSKLIMVKTVIEEQFNKKYRTGKNHYNSGAYKLAMENFVQIQEQWPHYPNLQKTIDQTKEKLLLVAKMERQLDQANRLLAEHQPGQAVQLLTPYMVSNINVKLVRPLFEQALTSRAKALRYDHLGQNNLNHDNKQAQLWFQKSYDYDHNDSVRFRLIGLYMQLGIDYFRRQRYQLAMDNWEAILKLAPHHAVVINYMKKTKEKMSLF